MVTLAHPRPMLARLGIPACWIAIAIAVSAAAAPLAAARLVEERGFATDLDSGQALYREQHLMRKDAAGGLLERLVVYRCTDGTPFARKLVDYRGAPKAPSFQFEDARSGFREGVLRGADGARVFVDPPGAQQRQGPLPDGPLVADAGFDTWVRAQWPALTRGERVPMDFLVPSRLRSYGFKVYQVDGDDAAGQRRFRLRLGGLLGLIAPHIDVVYAEADRRLLRFEGLSNLRDDAGDSQLEVRIDFPQPPTEADPSRWRQLAGEPLRACRVAA